MLTLTPQGLFCPAGNFHIDPSGAVENAVITHAHSDHARRGAQHYFSTASGEALLRVRLGPRIAVRSFAFGERFRFGEVSVSFHPAGHILGSAQVRCEHRGEVWVVSGDYKRDPDPTCEPFEPVACDVFITEATFGTPSFVWDKDADLGAEIFQWWQENVDKGVNSVLYAYLLGKTQRVLGLLQPHARKPVYCHPAATAISGCYKEQGIRLAPTRCLSTIGAHERLAGELVILPQSSMAPQFAQALGDDFETAFASGWMARSHHDFDRGFLLSDHADWNDLLKTVQETGAKKIFVQHRGNGALVKHLNKIGLRAFPESALTAGNPDQLELF